MRQSGIYVIENVANGKKYIGSSKDIPHRFKKHIQFLRGNAHHNSYLQSAWNKYGEHSFTFNIITECEEKELLLKEDYYIDYFKTMISSNGYNLLSANRQVFSDETRRRISISNTGKKRTEEVCRRISEIVKGRITSDETKEKISVANKGKKRTAIMCQNMRIARIGDKSVWFGKHLPDEVKKKISIANTGKKFSDEHRRKISIARRNMPESVREKIRQSLLKRYANEPSPLLGRSKTEEHRRNLSEAKKGKYSGVNSPMYGKHLSLETRQKISNSNKGQVAWNKGIARTPEERKKMSESRKRYLISIKNNKQEDLT